MLRPSILWIVRVVSPQMTFAHILFCSHLVFVFQYEHNPGTQSGVQNLSKHKGRQAFFISRRVPALSATTSATPIQQYVVCHVESIPARTGMPATVLVHFWILSQYKSCFVICAFSGVPRNYFCVQGLCTLKSNHRGTAPAACISRYLCTIAMLDFHKWGWQHSLLLGLPKNIYLWFSVLPNKVKIFMLGIWF